MRDVFLTFDDGPGPFCGSVLDALSQAGAPAMFFLCGREVDLRPALVQRIRAEGHALGNHTYLHPPLSFLAPSRAAEEIWRTNDAIHRACGARPALFRPPYGDMPGHVRRKVEDLGMTHVSWDVDTGDASGASVTDITDRATSRAGPGSIILLHEMPNTIRALPAIIRKLREQGLQPAAPRRLETHGR